MRGEALKEIMSHGILANDSDENRLRAERRDVGGDIRRPK